MCCPGCRSLVSMVACWRTVHLVVLRFLELSTLAVKPDSSFFLVAIKHLLVRLRRKSQMFPRSEMLDVVVVDGQARGVITRDIVGKIDVHLADCVVLATGGYGNVFYLSTNGKGCNVTAAWRAHRRGFIHEPLLHANSPDVYPCLVNTSQS